MAALTIEGIDRLAGRVTAPPDKSISHRALILAALGEGACEIHPLSPGGDNRSTVKVLRQLGVKIEVEGTTAQVHGLGDPTAFAAADAPLDCGNSGTTMRMMAGVLAAAPRSYELTGDGSLVRRPMTRLSPLVTMGARLSGREQGGKIFPRSGSRAVASRARGSTSRSPALR